MREFLLICMLSMVMKEMLEIPMLEGYSLNGYCS